MRIMWAKQCNVWGKCMIDTNYEWRVSNVKCDIPVDDLGEYGYPIVCPNIVKMQRYSIYCVVEYAIHLYVCERRICYDYFLCVLKLYSYTTILKL